MLEQPGCLHAAMDLNSPQLRMLAPRLHSRSPRGTCCVARTTACSRVPPAFRKAIARSRPTRDSARRQAGLGVPGRSRR
jgi:hypothetical protein